MVFSVLVESGRVLSNCLPALGFCFGYRFSILVLEVIVRASNYRRQLVSDMCRAVEFNWRGRFSADSRLKKKSIDASWSFSTFAIFSMTNSWILAELLSIQWRELYRQERFPCLVNASALNCVPGGIFLSAVKWFYHEMILSVFNFWIWRGFHRNFSIFIGWPERS